MSPVLDGPATCNEMEAYKTGAVNPRKRRLPEVAKECVPVISNTESLADGQPVIQMNYMLDAFVSEDTINTDQSRARKSELASAYDQLQDVIKSEAANLPDWLQPFMEREREQYLQELRQEQQQFDQMQVDINNNFNRLFNTGSVRDRDIVLDVTDAHGAVPASFPSTVLAVHQLSNKKLVSMLEFYCLPEVVGGAEQVEVRRKALMAHLGLVVVQRTP